jgi:Xaa-Pro aminopeptidase
MKNRRRFEPGEVVVVDAAAEYHGYAADVTRTIPVSGHVYPGATRDLQAGPRITGSGRAERERSA